MYSIVYNIFHFLIRVNCNRISEVLLYLHRGHFSSFGLQLLHIIWPFQQTTMGGIIISMHNRHCRWALSRNVNKSNVFSCGAFGGWEHSAVPSAADVDGNSLASSRLVSRVDAKFAGNRGIGEGSDNGDSGDRFGSVGNTRNVGGGDVCGGSSGIVRISGTTDCSENWSRFGSVGNSSNEGGDGSGGSSGIIDISGATDTSEVSRSSGISAPLTTWAVAWLSGSCIAVQRKPVKNIYTLFSSYRTVFRTHLWTFWISITPISTGLL
jgi:hypothetical protein